MPELFDMPAKTKFNYPGVIDRSVPLPEITPIVSEVIEEAPKPKAKASAKPKEPKEPKETTHKPLKLGKVKG